MLGVKKVINVVNDNLPAGLSGSSTCREYLAAGKADVAGQAILLQNGDYNCGQAPDATLDQIVNR